MRRGCSAGRAGHEKEVLLIPLGIPYTPTRKKMCATSPCLREQAKCEVLKAFTKNDTLNGVGGVNPGFGSNYTEVVAPSVAFDDVDVKRRGRN